MAKLAVKEKPRVDKPSVSQTLVEIPDEQWIDQTLCKLLQVTLKPPVSPSDGIHLHELALELQNESLPPVITPDLAERVVYARLQHPSNSHHGSIPLFDYLMAVWLRTAALKAQLNLSKESNRLSALDGLQTLCVSYAGLVLHPDMLDNFPQTHSHGTSYLGFKLVDGFEPQSQIPAEFFTAFIKRFEEDGLDEYLTPAVKAIVAAMRSKRIYDDYQRPIRALAYLASFKQVSQTIVGMNDWNPVHCDPRTIEILPILGPFFSRVSSFADSDPEISKRFFPATSSFSTDSTDRYGFNIGPRNVSDVESACKSLRDSSAAVVIQLQSLVLAFIKAGPEIKESILIFFARVVSLNAGRGKLHVNRKEVSTDGFMHNILQVCLKLCDPIMDARYSKLPLIDQHFLLYSNRIPLGDTTRILADHDAMLMITESYNNSHPSVPTANFVTEIFFLTLNMHHFGLLSAMRHYTSLIKEIEEMRKQSAVYVAQRDNGAWNSLQPYVRMANEEGLKRMLASIDDQVCSKLALDASLLDREILEHTMQFYGLVIVYILKVASGYKSTNQIAWDRVVRGDSQGVQLFPLPSSPLPEYVSLPEWFIEDICEFYLFIARNNPLVFQNHPRDEIMAFSMVFLMNPSYIKNPYLKSKLVEILFFFTLPLFRSPSGETSGHLDGVFITHPMAKTYLVKSILGFYVDVEQTGMHSQFYDKFNIRYNISQIMKCVLPDSGHRWRLVETSRDKEFFVRFAALLMNDATYLLDESLSKLKEISNIQVELSRPLAADASNEDKQHRQERESTLAQLERQAQSYVSLANETVHMLQYMTGNPEIVEPFMAPEVVERLAAMLDYNLVALAGPRCTELKVSNPEKYRFDPKKLLGELVSIFLHLMHRHEFVSSVAKDGRSYNKSIFMRVSGILSKHMIKNHAEIEKFVEFITKVEDCIQAEKQEEEELGDVPDEFLDPLLCSIMEEPVILPSSGVTIDLSTIKTHLLSDAHDPFNRQPLSLDQVQPNIELKQKIIDWKKSRRNN